MTPAQEDAFENAIQILREHFEGAVVIVDAEDEATNSDVRRYAYHGGAGRALGLMVLGQNHIIHGTAYDGDDE